MRRQPFILLSFSSLKKARKAQETQSYQRFQCIGHTGFNTSGTNGLRSLSLLKAGTHSALLKGSHTTAHTPKQGRCSHRCLEYFAPCYIWVEKSWRKRLHTYGVCPLSPAPQPRWAVGTYSFVTAWSFLHRYQSGQQREFSIKTIRRPNVHCKTECILLQYSEKSLEWRRYTICPLSLFAMTSRK